MDHFTEAWLSLMCFFASESRLDDAHSPRLHRPHQRMAGRGYGTATVRFLELRVKALACITRQGGEGRTWSQCGWRGMTEVAG